MGAIYGEWDFPNQEAPLLDAVIESLRGRTGLAITYTHGEDGNLVQADLTEIKERLFFWDRRPDRISVHSFVPAHPYLWAQLNNVMSDLGGELTDAPHAWQPTSASDVFNRHWSELSRRQRFILRLPTIGAWRPLDFLAQRER